jgi:hypothetical protein
MDWVPYKTLIGYNVANRPTLGRLWEAVYCVKEFASKAEALEQAISLAGIRILELFGHVEEAENAWEVIHERGPEKIGATYKDVSETLVTGTVATAAA